MSASSPSIVTAFDQKLPTNVVHDYSEPYRKIRSSTTSTKDFPPVSVYHEEAIDTYRGLFDRYFPRIGPGSPLSARMPVMERTHFLKAEADVLRLATLQLLHPVNIALDQICPPGTQVFCRTESSSSSTSRFDVEWSLRDAQGALVARLAVLEIKNTKVVHKGDFRPAAAGNEQALEAKLVQALEESSLTLLEGNAVWLSKQAGKYSKHCRYVAVFDWDAMFIFSFPSAQTNRPVRGLYFDESGRTGGMTFRRLLFAFVVRALKRTEALQLGRGQEDP